MPRLAYSKDGWRSPLTGAVGDAAAFADDPLRPDELDRWEAQAGCHAWDRTRQDYSLYEDDRDVAVLRMIAEIRRWRATER